MSEQDVTEDTQDRRRFYRINDKVSLNYRVIQAANIDQEIAKSNRRRRQQSELRNAMHAIDTRIEILNMKLAEDNPLVAETLNLFHRKISLHERMLDIDDYDDKAFSEAREINLSASGIAFEAETPLNTGTFLKMEIVTYPEHQYIPVFACVVQCKQLQDDSASGYHIAVEFKGISDEDEERIINHIFKLQAQEIKREKEKQHTAHGDSTNNRVSAA